MTEIIFPSASMKYDAHISWGASANSLFPTQKIDLYASIYSINKYGKHFAPAMDCGDISLR